MKRFLFQGDSITDAVRDKASEYSTNQGYPHLASSHLLFKHPGEYEFYNRGISGNRIVDVYARIKRDIINLKPDYLSILIGVNDVWHEISSCNGVDAEKFKKIYGMMIEEILAALPNTKIFILEPFVLKGSATEENWETFSTEVAKRAKAAREIAEQYKLIFVPLQEQLNNALKLVPDTSYWLVDGVHPNQGGQQLIADMLTESFDNNK